MSHSNDSTAAKRIRGLLDKDSFVEIGAFVTARGTDFNLADQDTPADGVVTGYGTIDDRLVYVYSQDASVLGGSVGEMHAKKIVRMYEMAMKMGAPVIGLIDCSGLRLQEATDALNAFGELYRCQALANGVVPQIQAVFGTCGAGMAVSAAMADFTFMESENAKIFIHSPNAIEGNTEKDLDNTTAEFQSNESGIADFTGTEEEIFEGIRALVTILPANNEDDMSYEECTDSLNRLISEADTADTAALVKAISDDGFVCRLHRRRRGKRKAGDLLEGSGQGGTLREFLRRLQYPGPHHCKHHRIQEERRHREDARQKGCGAHLRVCERHRP